MGEVQKIREKNKYVMLISNDNEKKNYTAIIMFSLA